MSNSNFNITKVVVDPVSQEISSLEVNGKPIETGGGNLQTIVYDSKSPLDVSALFPPGSMKPGEVQIEPDEGYDGIASITISPNGLDGYPEPNLQDKDLGFVASDSITITPDDGYDGLASVTFWTEAEIFSRTVNNVKYIGDGGLSFATAQDLEHIWRYDATSGDWKAVEFTKVVDSENELVTVTITDTGVEFDWNVE